MITLRTRITSTEGIVTEEVDDNIEHVLIIDGPISASSYVGISTASNAAFTGSAFDIPFSSSFGITASNTYNAIIEVKNITQSAASVSFTPTTNITSSNVENAVVEVYNHIWTPFIKNVSGFNINGIGTNNFFSGSNHFSGATGILVAALFRRRNSNFGNQNICGTYDNNNYGWALRTSPVGVSFAVYDVAGSNQESPITAYDGYSQINKWHVLVGQANIAGGLVHVKTCVDGIMTQNPVDVATVATSFAFNPAAFFGIGIGGGDTTTGAAISIEIAGVGYRINSLMSDFYGESADLFEASRLSGSLATPIGGWHSLYTGRTSPSGSWIDESGTNNLQVVGGANIINNLATYPIWGS